MSREISNTDDMIDSRDVIARIEELEDDRAQVLACVEDETRSARELDDWDADNGAELAALKSLADEAEGYAPDWHHGETLIRDSYFKDYARDLAEDLHGREALSGAWPFGCIDWEEAAQELQQDYTSVLFDGVTYWVR
jgi:hypothetical protein